MRVPDRAAWSPVWRVGARVVVVGLLTAIAVVNAAMESGAGFGRLADYVTAATAGAVGCCVALLLTRRIPWYVAPTICAAAMMLWGLPMQTLLAVAVYDLAVRRRAGPAVVFGLLALVGASISPSARFSWPQNLATALPLLAVAIGLGLWVGRRRYTVTTLHAEVEHLQIERKLGEERARASERARIAAEMHDVLAHRLSLIALHSGVLARRGADLPPPFPNRLELLRATSTEALSDLRDVLGALRDDRPPTASSRPILTDTSELVDQARSAGQLVDLEVTGESAGVPATHLLAVQRLVQEGLTNARKHALSGAVKVRIDYEPESTTVEIVNGPGGVLSETLSSGFGLVGLRERVVALGGTFDAGPSETGGWRIQARIPRQSAPDEVGPS